MSGRKKRSDYGSDADEWFASIDDSIASIAEELRSMILKAVPGANESIKWGTPVYENNGPVCSLCKGNGFIALQFGSIGTSLKNPGGLLEGTGKKCVTLRSGRGRTSGNRSSPCRLKQLPAPTVLNS
jgi:hypothetical protein